MKASILIVEDEGLIALDLKKRLEQVGYTVPAIADTAADALLAIERVKPDLILMDIRLRGPEDGIEAAEQIRRRFHLPVMFVTAHADGETLERAKITEPFGYIVKPFHSVDFRAQIEMALWKQKMEQRLRVSEAWLSATCRNVADALVATDSEGNIAFMNAPASKLTGWVWQEAKGKPLLEVFQAFEETTGLPAVHPLEALYDGRELATEARTFKLRKRCGDDQALIEARLSANRDEESLLGIIVVFSDITARRNAEEQNRKLQKMNALALMAAGLGAELDRSQTQLDDALTRLITHARSRGQSLLLPGEVYKRAAYQQSVVQQLIRLGQADIGQVVAVDLNEVITEMQAKARKTLGSARTLTLNLEPGIPPIKVDPQELRATLLSLVVNARKAMPDGGMVEISTTKIESAERISSVELVIRDNGRGVRTSAKERIFDPYYQSRPGIESPGFALALVYRFIVLNGGTIEVESVPGKGTAYLLRLPAAEDLSANANVVPFAKRQGA